MERAQETVNFDAKISQQRLDFEELPDGKGVQAILTLTLPGGKEFRFRENATAAEAANEMRVEGDFSDPEVAGFFGDIGKAIGKVAKGAVKAVQSVASSKVFKTAAAGLAAAAPALGPLAPAALAASGAMAVTSSLTKARHAASRGNKKAAAVHAAAAVTTARKIAPKNHKALLKIANDKSKGADRLAGQIKPSKASKPKPKPKPAPALQRGGALTPAALVQAARSGRVFMVKAA